MQNYIGKQIDRYHILDRLGMGGMAVVFKAYDTRLERDVALKLIRTEAIPMEQHERLLKRFEREAKSQARFSHPNIVSVYDYGDENGAPFLVMEYIKGGMLKDKAVGPVPWRRAVGWLVPIADALKYAHTRNVIHRDIKPSNILFDEDERPLLTDFGIAKILETDEATLTGTGMGVGTPEYMAPEQWLGKTTEATDQYALGVVLYELITGQKPYQADTPAAVAILQATESIVSPGRLVTGIPQEVEDVVNRALERKPEDRYQDMDTFRDALGALLAGSVGQARDYLSSAQKAKEVYARTEADLLVVETVDNYSAEEDLFETADNFDEDLPNSSERFLNDNAVTVIRDESETTDSSDFGQPDNEPTNQNDQAEMVLVPAGEFVMGSEDFLSYVDERPEHLVNLDSFWIYKFEVTNLQYARFLNARGNQQVNGVPWFNQDNNSANLYLADDRWHAKKGFQNHPVVHVTWFGAQAYCRWAGCRLPTEAEWEKAARGPDGWIYPWGNYLEDRRLANFSSNRTAPVGDYPEGASPYGAMDMVGNVWEWVADWYDFYNNRRNSQTNPTGPEDGSVKVFRGGSFLNDEKCLRTTIRYWDSPDKNFNNLGFRCVKNASDNEYEGGLGATTVDS